MNINLQSANALSTLLDSRFKAVRILLRERRFEPKLTVLHRREQPPLEGNMEEPSVGCATAPPLTSDVWDVIGALASTSTPNIGSRRPLGEVQE